MEKFILSIDQGTTTTRAILYNHDGIALYKAIRPLEALFPNPGWVEEDPLQIWISVVDAVNEVLIISHKTMANIDSIGITNQRETTIVWDKETGVPIYNAIVWQSRQSLPYCEKIHSKESFINQKTGLLINPYFSASKIRYILDNVEGAQKRAEKGELAFGTVDTWLLNKLTEGKTFATDISNASRTMLFNIFEKKWDEDLLKIFNIPRSMLAEVKPCSYDYGIATYLSPNVHILGVAGDQQAALFGQNCFDCGDLKNTYGTGCFMLMNIGETPILSKKGLLTTIAWSYDDKVTYALEGSVFIGGAVVQWLRDKMELIKTSEDSERVANKVETSEGIYIVPAFVGLGTPYWDNKARGSIFGLTRGSSRGALVRASLEAIAYQSKDVIEVMKKEANLDFTSLKVDGGATDNKLLLQFQADILGVDIMLPTCLETTSLGVAYFAGLKSGFWSSLEEIKKTHSYQAVFTPKMKIGEAKRRYKGWKLAVKCTQAFKLDK